MKIAILLTGFLRTYLHTYDFLKNNLINSHSCDIYPITWEEQEDKRLVNKNSFDIYSHNIINFKIINNAEYYKNKKYFIPLNRSNDVFITNERAKVHGHYWANRLFDQWYLVQQGFKLIKNPHSYDCIIRLRYDLQLRHIDIKKGNNLIIPKDIGGWNFTDHMAYGNVINMEKYCHLNSQIFEMYENHNIDITHAVDMPRFYMQKNNIPYEIDNNIKYEIFK